MLKLVHDPKDFFPVAGEAATFLLSLANFVM